MRTCSSHAVPDGTMRASRAAALGLVAASVVLLLALAPTWAQDAAVRYVYDDLGRLIAVVDQQGSVATYVRSRGQLSGRRARRRRRDSRIPRYHTGDPEPRAGRDGRADLRQGLQRHADQQRRALQRHPGDRHRGGPNPLLTSLPPGATTGSITVTVGANTATSPSPFTVGSTLAVTPPTATVWVNGTVQLQATEGGT